MIASSTSTPRVRLARLLALAPLLLALHPALLEAQSEAASPRSATARPVAQAAPAPEGITLDGHLDEEAWGTAEPITDFTQNDPEEGRPVSQPTEVRILYDADALYVGARLLDSEPIASRLGRRDAWLRDSDWFSIALDSYDDNLTAYRFMVNPAGVRSDEVLSASSFRGDDSWDPVWEVETAVSDSGWTVEMRIPFSQLRFSAEATQVWGIQLERTIARRQEEAVFAFTPKAERGGIAAYGRLVGLRDLHRGRGLELMPYAVGRAELVPVDRPADAPFEDPYRDGADFFGSMGLDLKYRLASNLTLDATVNPDFGQVEVDPAVVNLSAFETRFDERRPFFVEGSDIFRFGGGGGFGGGGFGAGTNLLYSRRIGGSPRWSEPAEALYTETPDAATILGAAKLTGRTAGGWTVGLLEAVTGEERGRFITAEGARGEEVVAPLSNYLAARAQKNLRQGRTVVGGIATAVNRDVAETPLAARMRASAYTGGLDFRHEWAERAWALSGYVAGSRIAGDADAIARAQTSSARYFHRPDATHVTFDSTASSLAGYTANLELSKQAGLHWRGSAELSATSPGFEVNDLGFQRDADRLEAELSVRYVESRPGPVLRDWSVSVGPDATWNFGGDYLGTGVSTHLRGELLSYWRGELRFSRDFPGLDDRLTRGGPLARELARNRLSAQVNSDSRKPWTLRADVTTDWDAAGGDELELQLDLELRPSAAVSISIGPEWSRERSTAQYLGSIDDTLATATFGARYLFAALDQTTLSFDTRLNVTFRPGLTLQVFAQPFLASGAFDGVKELRAPETFSFLRYGEDIGTVVRDGDDLVVDPDGPGPAEPFRLADEDFARRSLRGNAVLRWEWRPGSTLYLVWQQTRASSEHFESLALGRDARALFRAPADNLFVVKVSYWFSP
ncbi:MAG TPA: DUF5916 domain-containing protein [Longimicrobiales bacterium]|nr:DUF5916 domain-containing protein [Longimicrobiales bacterium]